MSHQPAPYAGADRREPVSYRELEQVATAVTEIERKMQVHTEQEIRMEGRIANIEGKLEKIDTALSALTDAWTQSKGALKFITVLVGICAAGWQIVVWLKDHVIIKGS